MMYDLSLDYIVSTSGIISIYLFHLYFIMYLNKFVYLTYISMWLIMLLNVYNLSIYLCGQLR
ncbi:MAG: hypothetical protein RIQ77_96 [Pseudomonadota bacterium]